MVVKRCRGRLGCKKEGNSQDDEEVVGSLFLFQELALFQEEEEAHHGYEDEQGRDHLKIWVEKDVTGDGGCHRVVEIGKDNGYLGPPRGGDQEREY